VFKIVLILLFLQNQLTGYFFGDVMNVGQKQRVTDSFIVFYFIVDIMNLVLFVAYQ